MHPPHPCFPDSNFYCERFTVRIYLSYYNNGYYRQTVNVVVNKQLISATIFAKPKSASTEIGPLLSTCACMPVICAVCASKMYTYGTHAADSDMWSLLFVGTFMLTDTPAYLWSSSGGSRWFWENSGLFRCWGFRLVYSFEFFSAPLIASWKVARFCTTSAWQEIMYEQVI